MPKIASTTDRPPPTAPGSGGGRGAAVPVPHGPAAAAGRPRVAALSVLGALLGAGVAGWALWVLLDRRLLGAIWGSVGARPEILLIFLVPYLGAFVLRAVAWGRLLRTPVPLPGLVGILHAALFANHALPAKAGDVLRGVLANRRGVPAAEAAATTGAARLLDVAALLAIVGTLGPAALAGGGPGASATWATALLVAAAGAAALVGGVWLVARPGAAPARRWPGAARFALALREAIRALPRGRGLAAAFGWTLAGWALEAGALIAVSVAAGLEVPVWVAVAVTAFTVLAQTVAILPGNVGVYEAVMTGALVAHGIEPATALTLAAATHAMKFAYAFAGGAALLAARAPGLLLGRVRASTAASRLELYAARAWNVLNEGKPFTPVFAVTVLLVAQWVGDPVVAWTRMPLGIALAVPLALVLYRFDFPLHLRWALWGLAALFAAWFRFVSLDLVAVALVLYAGFTVVLWGSVYYHLRIGVPLTNFTRFWRLVLENPDPTSANFLEQAPKVFLLTHVAVLAPREGGPGPLPLLLFAAVAGAVALLVHRWWFTWRPALPVRPPARTAPGPPRCRRFILIVVDGCRADRLAEARTPVLDRLAREGLRCTAMETVHPARTVTGFSSMLTGATPREHGMRSNFVPRLGVRCESVFDVLRASGRTGRLVGIAHLVDAFGEDVRAVSAVRDNDAVDAALIAEAKDELLRHDPDLLVLQLLSVDQTGHARGSYRQEYLERIEATDAAIGELLAWLGEAGYLNGATIGVTSDHGQGRGVGGHGHLSDGERVVPFVLWGAGVPRGVTVEETRSLVDVAPTVCAFLGLPAPAASVGRPIVDVDRAPRPLAVIVPAHNEAERLPWILERIPRDLGEVRTIVVDDGSTDGTARVAEAFGATVLRHGSRRGLGAALRTGMDAAHALEPWAAVYVDADGEYDPAEMPALLEPIRAGRAGYVLGSRFRDGATAMRPSRRLANRVFTLLVCAFSGRRVGDAQTGFRAFGPEALAAGEIVHDYNYAQVLTLDLLAKGIRLAEVPITYRLRTGGRSFVRPEYLWRVPLGMARELVRD